MPVLTEPSGRRRLDVGDDRLALLRPGAAGLLLTRADGHVLALSRHGKWLTQSGTASARPGRLPVEGFDTAGIRAACLAAGWHWKGSGRVEWRSRAIERAVRPPSSVVTRHWSRAARPLWPHVRRRLAVDALSMALIAAGVWAATWAASRVGWGAGPWGLDEMSGLVLFVGGLSAVRTAGAYRRAGQDDQVRVSAEEITWRAADSAALLTRDQVRTVVDSGASLRFIGSDGDLAQVAVPGGHGELAETLQKHGWTLLRRGT
ncbi:hypothetical protein AB0I28_24270 [Phytomonospora sp. NPDC050363]|uniref:hypothetical protein n=1 Tax=Phytomonospora sp. NPDC050363 TaxID=3155642 RepID=UPI0033E54AB6